MITSIKCLKAQHLKTITFNYWIKMFLGIFGWFLVLVLEMRTGWVSKKMMDGVQGDERLTDTRGPGELVEMDGEKNHLRNKVCCNPDAILWQFPYPFVVDVFWYEFFRQAGEQLWYECYSRQDDNFSDRQEIKEGLTLQSIKFGGWQSEWKPGFYYGVCVARLVWSVY